MANDKFKTNSDSHNKIDPKEVSGVNPTDRIKTAMDINALLAMSNDDWDDFLREQLGVFMLDGDKYVAKPFNKICYKQVSKDEASEKLVENAAFILKKLVFKEHTEAVYKCIDNILKRYKADPTSYILNLDYKSNEYGTKRVKDLPQTCIAFRNGVYDFAKNDWLFIYDKQIITENNQIIIRYPLDYIVYWYVDLDFTAIDGFDITQLTSQDFIDTIRASLCPKGSSQNNYTFELVWNMAHDSNDEFSLKKFEHLCKIMGYMIYQNFSNYFIYLVGNGQNGKNTLFDSTLKHYIKPTPTGQSLDDIEEDKFVTASFINTYQNIYLESEAKPVTRSSRLKQITGSMYQSIEQKGIDKFTAMINCKMMFSANDKEKLKFTDSTTGLNRRINLYEVFFHWDKKLAYMDKGDKDWYDTTCSENLHEITGNPTNMLMYCYMGMLGIKLATKNFTKESFDFGEHNEWDAKIYIDYNESLYKRIQNALNFTNIKTYIKTLENEKKYKDIVGMLRVGNESIFSVAGFENSKYAPHKYKAFLDDVGEYEVIDTEDGENISQFVENDLHYILDDNIVYLYIPALMKLVNYVTPQQGFISELKKMYTKTNIKKIGAEWYIPLRINADNGSIVVANDK